MTKSSRTLVVILIAACLSVGSLYIAARLLRILMISIMAWAGSGPEHIVESYDPATTILLGDTTHLAYETRVIDDVFLSAYLTGLNATRATEGPPYSVVVGCYLIADEIKQVRVVEAWVRINDQEKTSFIDGLDKRLVLCTPDLDKQRTSEWISSEYVITAKPINGDRVTIELLIEVQGGLDEEPVQKRFLFDFVPVVKKVIERYF